MASGLSPGFAWAGRWTINPYVELAGTYSDNIRLESSDEQSDFVTEINPGVSANKFTGRTRFFADYRMQNVFHANNSSANTTYHQLQGGLTSELVRNHFFVDARATYSQQIIDRQRPGGDNINITDNRSDVGTFSISPYYRAKVKDWFDMNLRYTYATTYIETGASDADTHTYDALFTSDRRQFQALNWNLRYRRQEQKRDDASDATFESWNGTARYQITRKWYALGQAGYENNDFVTSGDENNGSYWAVGAGYSPNRNLRIEGLTGKNFSRVSLRTQPTRRTSALLSWRDSDVGANTGEVWTANLQHYTKRSTWGLTYTEDTNTFQQQFLEEQGRVLVDLDGNPITDPVTGEPFAGSEEELAPIQEALAGLGTPFNVVDQTTLSFTDDVSVFKTGRAFINYRSGKSAIRWSVFNERRESKESPDEVKGYGTQLSWDWRFAPRSSSVVSGDWRRDETQTAVAPEEKTDLWSVRVGLNHTFARKIGPRARSRAVGTADIRHTKSSSDVADRDYVENRIRVAVVFFF